VALRATIFDSTNRNQPSKKAKDVHGKLTGEGHSTRRDYRGTDEQILKHTLMTPGRAPIFKMKPCKIFSSSPLLSTLCLFLFLFLHILPLLAQSTSTIERSEADASPTTGLSFLVIGDWGSGDNPDYSPTQAAVAQAMAQVGLKCAILSPKTRFP
jgi:hypothetical protein